MTFLQDSYPILIKEVHLINYPYVFNIGYSIIRPFLTEKMKDRVSSYLTITLVKVSELVQVVIINIWINFRVTVFTSQE